MKPMTEVLRLKIQKYIKNRIDISELIYDVEIKGENLSGAVIKSLVRPGDDLTRTNFSKAIIGEKGCINNISGAKMRSSVWCDAHIEGIMYMRRVDARNADFSGCVMIDCEYQYSDFRGAKFCEAGLRIGTDYGFKAKFDQDMFKDLTAMWNLDVRVKAEGE